MKKAFILMFAIVSSGVYADERFDFYYSQQQYDRNVLLMKKKIPACLSFLTVGSKTIPFTEVMATTYLPIPRYTDYEKVAENIIIDKSASITRKCQ